MENTNFQTIHQMHRAINDFVKQATGRDSVQNIDIDHVTVAQNKHYEEIGGSGRIVSFSADGSIPLEKCIAQIEPVQDFNGYDHPWPAGGGKNKLQIIPFETKISNGITITYNNDGTITVDGTSTARVFQYLRTYTADWFPEGKTYTFRMAGLPVSAVSAYLNFNYSDDGATYAGSYGTLTGNRTRTMTSSHRYNAVLFDIPPNQSFNNNKIYVNAEEGETVGEWTPYSNICPITGWTRANIYLSPTTDAQDGTTYSVTFPAEAGTVYGGTLDVINGNLKVTHGYIGSYNGETLPGKWISDRDVYAEGTSPTTGAEVVYELDNPITYTFTPQEIRTLLGQNYIWADTGDIEAMYKVLRELY